MFIYISYISLLIFIFILSFIFPHNRFLNLKKKKGKENKKKFNKLFLNIILNSFPLF